MLLGLFRDRLLWLPKHKELFPLSFFFPYWKATYVTLLILQKAHIQYDCASVVTELKESITITENNSDEAPKISICISNMIKPPSPRLLFKNKHQQME